MPPKECSCEKPIKSYFKKGNEPAITGVYCLNCGLPIPSSQGGSPNMKEVMEKVDKQVGRAVERLGSEGSQKEEGFDGLDAIKHIADGRTCLSIKGGLCPCQKEGVRSLLLKERERAEEKVAELETEIDLLKIDIESLESAARGKDVTNKE